MAQHPKFWFTFGFGTGLLPFAPGTWGTLPGIPIYFLLQFLSPVSYFSVVLFLTIIGFWFCDIGCKALGVYDHKAIVWDEIVGYLFTMFMVPLSWKWIVVGFVLFRIFDILKPWPISWLEKHFKSGIGVMLDDVAAGIFAFICMYIILFFS